MKGWLKTMDQNRKSQPFFLYQSRKDARWGLKYGIVCHFPGGVKK